MKYLTHDDKYWACDIEADNFLEQATCIHVVCVENINTGEKRSFRDAASFKEWLVEDFILVGHNFIAYDLVMLNRFWIANIGITRVIDTFVLSQLYNPVLSGGHSLEAWGKRLKHPKTEYSDFSRYTPEMEEYCQNDTSLTAKLYRKLSSRMVAVGFSEEGAEIEHLSWNIIQNKQRRHGFPFDIQKAHQLYVTLRAREEELRDEIYRLWPPTLLPIGHFKRAYKANGEPTSLFLRHSQQYPKITINLDGGYTAFDYVAFNLGSPKQRIDKLLELGWQPTEYNYKRELVNGRWKKVQKGPKVNEETLLEFAEKSGINEISAIAKWLVVNSRANMVRTWMDAYNEETGAIHGKLFIASTLRYRHASPNSANIPAVRTYDKDHILAGKPKLGEEGTWAFECRSLFYAGDDDDYVLVGVDAKGIQIRILLNYAYSEEAVDLYMQGDPHVNNAQILGLANKPAAKKFFYTTIMGGQGARLAADQAQFGTKLTAQEGNVLRQQLIDSVPGFKELIERLEKELEKTGRITLCDGTPILVSSPHMVIPYLLQGDESRIMKKASILLDKEIRREKIDAKKVADIHDEWQFVVRRRDIPRFMALAISVFPVVGRHFNYKVLIEGDAKKGLTWAETH